LIGDLGAGKTTLTKGLASEITGISPHQINSPTFTYLNVYEGDERHQALMMLDQMVVIQRKNSKKLTICEAAKGYDGDIFREPLLHN
ncbi:MAG: tRNA (adenosine(37)-N6)-threonylcarbamoyltransferase complex ATPase subunit type 1 TsaE, partial [Simkaniaceae bacterium]|nr:tRNA (adenosine(37)-N6)-threonylcarbamoyltransferase complex ATPase subunit type 1 TsaE [Simkaniaceae bacterium]